MNSNARILYDDGSHKCIMFSIDEEEHEERFLSLNQYLIINNGKGLLLDPGSATSFDVLVDAITPFIALEHISLLFFSHQDPDVAGAINEWCTATKAKLIISSLWVRFMSHYGLVDMSRLVPLEDQGATIHLEEGFLRFIPAHFLHSPGNFSLYDAKANILFSGDIGAAITPLEDRYKDVTNFEAHLPFLEGFHKRYIAGNRFCRAWVQCVQPLAPTLIAPQHGALFEGENVTRFLQWFESLQCGGDLLETLYPKG